MRSPISQYFIRQAISLFHRLSSRDDTAIATDPPFGVGNLERGRRRAAEVRIFAERMTHLPLATAEGIRTAGRQSRKASQIKIGPQLSNWPLAMWIFSQPAKPAGQQKPRSRVRVS